MISIILSIEFVIEFQDNWGNDHTYDMTLKRKLDPNKDDVSMLSNLGERLNTHPRSRQVWEVTYSERGTTIKDVKGVGKSGFSDEEATDTYQVSCSARTTLPNLLMLLSGQQIF